MSWDVAQTSWDGVPFVEKHVHTCTRRTHWIMWKVIRRQCTTVAIVMREELGAVLGWSDWVWSRARATIRLHLSIRLHLQAFDCICARAHATFYLQAFASICLHVQASASICDHFLAVACICSRLNAFDCFGCSCWHLLAFACVLFALASFC